MSLHTQLPKIVMIACFIGVVAGCAPRTDADLWSSDFSQGFNAATRNDYQQAEKFYRQALKDLRAMSSDDIRRGHVHYALACAYQMQKQPENARIEYEEAWKVVTRPVNSRDRLGGDVGLALGMVNHAAARYSEAEKNYLLAQSCYSAKPEWALELANTRRQLAILYTSTGKVDEAYRLFDLAHSYYAQIDDRKKLALDPEIANMYWIWGGLLHSHGQYAKAAMPYQQSGLLYEQVNSVGKQAACLERLGQVNQQQKEFKDAVNYYRKALGLVSKLSAPDQAELYCKAAILVGLGECLDQTEQFSESQNFLREADQILAKQQKADMSILGRARLLRAVALRRMGRVVTANSVALEAVEALSLALRTNPADPNIFCERAEANILLHQNAAAIADLKNAIRFGADPKRVRARIDKLMAVQG